MQPSRAQEHPNSQIFDNFNMPLMLGNMICRLALVAFLAFPGALSKCICKEKRWVPGAAGNWCRPGGRWNQEIVHSIDTCWSFCATQGMDYSSCCMYYQSKDGEGQSGSCQFMTYSATYDGAPYKGGACFGIQCDEETRDESRAIVYA
mmetsp:Transcript_26108/g.47352  ORF Transcript_26108/g.47352 Transcript_26108/m.47352 type:complete len:148 (-) Transcript_26108:409-852(-)